MRDWLLVFVGVLVIASGCCKEIKDKLATCEEQLENCCDNCPPPPTEAAFELVLEADSYGTFLPVNNQFKCPPEPHSDDAFPGDSTRCREFRSGFFLQLSDFVGALHSYDKLELQFEVGPSEEIWRKDFRWIDIDCSDGSGEALTSTMAAELVSQTAGDGRLLHHDMDPDPDMTNLMTLWKAASGLTVSVSGKPIPGDPPFAHSHDIFAFQSGDSCKVRIWDGTGATAIKSKEYLADAPENRVVKIRVLEDVIDAPHGGVHHPPWG